MHPNVSNWKVVDLRVTDRGEWRFGLERICNDTWERLPLYCDLYSSSRYGITCHADHYYRGEIYFTLRARSSEKAIKKIRKALDKHYRKKDNEDARQAERQRWFSEYRKEHPGVSEAQL